MERANRHSCEAADAGLGTLSDACGYNRSVKLRNAPQVLLHVAGENCAALSFLPLSSCFAPYLALTPSIKPAVSLNVSPCNEHPLLPWFSHGLSSLHHCFLAQATALSGLQPR